MKALIQAINQYQKLKGLTDQELALALDIDNSMISRIKSGQREPGGKVLKAMAKIPELSMAVFTYLTEKETVAAKE